MTAGERPVRHLDVIARDDALLDALARGDSPERTDPLALGLAEWRRDLESAPLRPGLLRRGTVRVGRGVAGAAVASVVALGSVGGVAAAATQAEPGSALWPITRIVAADRAHSREAADHARSSLQRATTAADQDRRDAAEHYLSQAEQDTLRVRGDDGGGQLRDEAAALRRRIDGQGASPSASPSPSVTPSPSGTLLSASPSATPSDSPTPSDSGTWTLGPSPDRSAPSPVASPQPEPTRSPRARRTPAPQRTPQPAPTATPTRSPQPSPVESLLRLLLP
jgi:hypothetical protein